MKKITLGIVFIIGLAAFSIQSSYFSPLKTGDPSQPPDYLKLQKIAQENIGTQGDFATDGFDATRFLKTWNFNHLPPEERSHYYRETALPDGTLLREYWLSVEEKEVEIAPGLFYPAWTYNGQVPGPTIRATEGDSIKIYFKNESSKPHTIHFHGLHKSEFDGALPDQYVLSGKEFVYEFKAEPYGFHLYHCHTVPISQHISHGLYGGYIVDPKQDVRPKANHELVMIMNGFDSNFDGENDVYAVNSQAFIYAKQPIQVKKDELVRIYLGNMLEFDPINSFHLHANFFDEYPTGTKQAPQFYTDITSMAQGQRSILDVRFKEPGTYMFHAHVTEFTELGWMGMFMVSPN